MGYAPRLLKKGMEGGGGEEREREGKEKEEGKMSTRVLKKYQGAVIKDRTNQSQSQETEKKNYIHTNDQTQFATTPDVYTTLSIPLCIAMGLPEVLL